MADETNISWADATFNPWIGCTKVSPACDGCYAEALMGGEGRFSRVQWGAPGKGDGTRDRTAPANWKKPRKWNREAAAAPGKTFVFCASLADVFDNAVPAEWRRDLFDLIRATPHLTWLLLTKRPGNIVKLWREAQGVDLCWCGKGTMEPGKTCDCGAFPNWPPNAAIGCTVVSQEEADRDIPKLLAAKDTLNPAFAFLSMEPLLGPVDLEDIPVGPLKREDYVEFNALTGSGFYIENDDGDRGASPCEFPTLDWVITGGETDQGAHKARPADPAWFRSLRDQCAAAGVPFHFKQWGEWQPLEGREFPGERFLFANFGDHGVYGIGKDRDPCTLDGVTHDARPEVRP